MTNSIHNLEKKNNKINFKLKDIDVSVLNSIRRVILSEIPNVAFEFKPYNIENQKIIIETNTCPLHNEIIQQRLSMIPLNFTVDQINDFDEDEDKYNFVLNEKNKSESIMDITTEHIKIYDNNNKKYDDKIIYEIFPKNKITNDFILITKLKPNIINKENGNEISIKMTATKDIAKNYSGFGYVSQCSYFNIVDEVEADKLLNKKIDEGRTKKMTSEELEDLQNNFNNLERQRIFRKNKYGEPNYFEFNIESECRVSPEYLFFKAIEIIIEKINKLITNILDDNITFQKVNATENMYNLLIDGETHTLGNLIQSLLYNILIRDDEKENINFIGYNCPHPLENKMIIKIQFVNNKALIECKNIFIGGLEKIIKLLNDIKIEWIKKSKLENYSKDIS
jgi:DNA-directed RNA polymerase subunit L